MVCLENFYKETGLSRTMFGDIAGVSSDTLRKYEWSNTDRMRKSTIEKIEGYARKALSIGLRIEPLHFGNGWTVRWERPIPDEMSMKSINYYNSIQFIRGLLDRGC